VKSILSCLVPSLLVLLILGCSSSTKPLSIGSSFGVVGETEARQFTSFAVTPGEMTGQVNLTWTYPKTEFWTRFEIRKQLGSIAPSCEGGVVAVNISDFSITKFVDNCSSTGQSVCSYRVCIFDRVGTLIVANAVENVAPPKFDIINVLVSFLVHEYAIINFHSQGLALFTKESTPANHFQVVVVRADGSERIEFEQLDPFTGPNQYYNNSGNFSQYVVGQPMKMNSIVKTSTIATRPTMGDCPFNGNFYTDNTYWHPGTQVVVSPYNTCSGSAYYQFAMCKPGFEAYCKYKGNYLALSPLVSP
jgi:hypothetical protein